MPISFVGYGITIFLSAALNGLGRPVQALMISGGCAIGLLAPAVWVGVLLAGFDGNAVATVVVNVLAGLIGLAVIMCRHSLSLRQDGRASSIDSPGVRLAGLGLR